MPGPITRRSTLQLGGTALFGSLTGCSMSALTGSEGLILGDIIVTDSSTEHHTVRLELERGNELVREATYDFPGTEKKTMQASWSRDPAIYTLYTVVQGPLADEDGDLNLYVNKLTSEDAAPNAKDCSVVHVQISTPPEPGSVGIGTVAPKPKWGDCTNNPASESK